MNGVVVVSFFAGNMLIQTALKKKSGLDIGRFFNGFQPTTEFFVLHVFLRDFYHRGVIDDSDLLEP